MTARTAGTLLALILRQWFLIFDGFGVRNLFIMDRTPFSRRDLFYDVFKREHFSRKSKKSGGGQQRAQRGERGSRGSRG